MLLNITVRIDEKVKEKIAKLAKADGRSFADYVRRILDKHLKK